MDLGIFLGMGVIKLNNGSLQLTQSKYSMKILLLFRLLECKPCSTSVVQGSKLSKIDGELLDNVIKFCQIVSSLQYLTKSQ